MKKYRRVFILIIVASMFLGLEKICFAEHRNDYKDEYVPVPVCVRCKLSLGSGIYVGAGFGWDNFRVSQNVNVVLPNNILLITNPKINTQGPLVNATLGYGQFYDWFYIAGEIYANYSEANTSYSLGSYNTQINTRMTYGAGILPGIRMTPASLVYARVGAEKTYFKVRENGTQDGDFTRTDGNTGLNFGFGLETIVLPQVSLRTDYIYTKYGTFISFIDTKFKMADSRFILGLYYRFC